MGLVSFLPLLPGLGSVNLLVGKLLLVIPDGWLGGVSHVAPAASPDWDGGMPAFLHCPYPFGLLTTQERMEGRCELWG